MVLKLRLKRPYTYESVLHERAITNETHHADQVHVGLSRTNSVCGMGLSMLLHETTRRRFRATIAPVKAATCDALADNRFQWQVLGPSAHCIFIDTDR